MSHIDTEYVGFTPVPHTHNSERDLRNPQDQTRSIAENKAQIQKILKSLNNAYKKHIEGKKDSIRNPENTKISLDYTLKCCVSDGNIPDDFGYLGSMNPNQRMPKIPQQKVDDFGYL